MIGHLIGILASYGLSVMLEETDVKRRKSGLVRTAIVEVDAFRAEVCPFYRLVLTRGHVAVVEINHSKAVVGSAGVV